MKRDIHWQNLVENTKQMHSTRLLRKYLQAHTSQQQVINQTTQQAEVCTQQKFPSTLTGLITATGNDSTSGSLFSVRFSRQQQLSSTTIGHFLSTIFHLAFLDLNVKAKWKIVHYLVLDYVPFPCGPSYMYNVCRSCCTWKKTIHSFCLAFIGLLVLFCIVDLGLPKTYFVTPIGYHCWIDNWFIPIGLTFHSIQVQLDYHMWLTKCISILLVEENSGDGIENGGLDQIDLSEANDEEF
ncbi:PREDICTED: uncharacterized protein LOC109211959 [Nicotiana attenuata]|uniref:uncharacterized protein LOC109211959 n=1 Tax=Nicotiana attenuata TaxID=49451 RepID=UPI000905CF8D|nr:PREDICTED: uncharacterized protein LOC109211959 [Nicotiana attenuata]